MPPRLTLMAEGRRDYFLLTHVFNSKWDKANMAILLQSVDPRYQGRTMAAPCGESIVSRVPRLLHILRRIPVGGFTCEWRAIWRGRNRFNADCDNGQLAPKPKAG